MLDATHGTTSGFSGSHSSGLLQPVAISTSGTGGLSAIAERRSLDDSAAQGQLSEEDLDEEEMDMFEADVAAAGQTGPAGGEPDAEDDSDEERVGGLAKGLENERTLKSGYLLKKGERRKAWKKRWFVLRTARLAYYKDHRVSPKREPTSCRKADIVGLVARNTSYVASSRSVTSGLACPCSSKSTRTVWELSPPSEPTTFERVPRPKLTSGRLPSMKLARRSRTRPRKRKPDGD